jgi:glycosyltransferase involved in cell wall biosynthesis
MKIAIDARWVFKEISGIGEYTRQLITHLVYKDAANEYVLIFSDPALLQRTMRETHAEDAPRFLAVLVPFGIFSIAGQIKLPGLLREWGVDVFHSTNYMIPLLAFPRRRPHSIRCVATIHDVIPMIFPHHAPQSMKSRFYPFYRFLMREIGRRADRIITDSRASRQDVVRYLNIPGPRQAAVRAVYCGVADRFIHAPRTPQPPSSPLTVLYVGRPDPYKNLALLIRAFASARKQLATPMILKLIGSDDPRYPEPRELANSLGLGDSVVWTGYLHDQELVDTYRTADLLVHPSRYEGFGLQIVEAMMSGLPVICSNGGSLPEVAGDAAIVLPPDDEAGFTDHIIRVLSDPSLQQAMREKGYLQAAQFNWRRNAEETLAIYRELV